VLLPLVSFRSIYKEGKSKKIINERNEEGKTDERTKEIISSLISTGLFD
jgi:hypothetical protein